ncbi:hypothetical protein EQG41_12595 [Billgrantia azerbaijanica]|nr:hypothetical protein EQG41_12595 [Halomonas azerbaijanica]
MKSRVKLSAGIVALSFFASSVQAQNDFLDAIGSGKVNLDVRYRFELVDQDGFDKEAEASTVRTRLGYRTGGVHGLVGHIEFSDTRAVKFDNYQDADTPVVADPEVTELNRAYLEYGGLTDTVAKLGRQRVILDNHRWVGNVGWRQQEQTFDAATVVTEALPGLVATYGYLWQRNMITGARQDQDSHLLNVSYDALPWLKATGYGYWLDFEEDAPGLSSETFGLRLTGAGAISAGMALGYVLEYARQSDAADNPSDYDLDYGLAELSLTVAGVKLLGAYELLEGDGTNAVQTPLATLHGKNGWADQFLRIPADGLVDRYVSVSGSPLERVNLALVYHDYEADNGSSSYGSEIDFVANWKLTPQFSVGAKYADYDADEHSVDTQKAWLYMAYSL